MGLPPTEELSTVYLGVVQQKRSDTKQDCYGTIFTFAKARIQLRLSAAELKRVNSNLKSRITEHSVFDVLQSSSLSLAQTMRQILDKAGENPTEVTLRQRELEQLEQAVYSVESRLCAEEDRGAERHWNKEFQDILGILLFLAFPPFLTDHPSDSFSIPKTELDLTSDQAALFNRYMLFRANRAIS